MDYTVNEANCKLWAKQMSLAYELGKFISNKLGVKPSKRSRMSIIFTLYFSFIKTIGDWLEIILWTRVGLFPGKRFKVFMELASLKRCILWDTWDTSAIGGWLSSSHRSKCVEILWLGNKQLLKDKNQWLTYPLSFFV